MFLQGTLSQISCYYLALHLMCFIGVCYYGDVSNMILCYHTDV